VTLHVLTFAKKTICTLGAESRRELGDGVRDGQGFKRTIHAAAQPCADGGDSLVREVEGFELRQYLLTRRVERRIVAMANNIRRNNTIF
jgi:hypothetical protein